MSTKIYDSVGINGRNVHIDVVTVQTLLKRNDCNPGPVDGVCGRRTVNAIIVFQHKFMDRPDGRVDVGGPTFRRLAGGTSGAGGATAAPAVPRPSQPEQDLVPTLPTSVAKDLSKMIKIDKSAFNKGLTATNNAHNFQVLGNPRPESGTNGANWPTGYLQVTNQKLLKNMVSAPLKGAGQGLRPAVASLNAVLDDIQRKYPDVRRLLSSDGMLVCRRVKLKGGGWGKSVSNHSWGAAIDLRYNGVFDSHGDGVVLAGLALIAPIFNDHGWYWGATFKTEDGMHFEGSRELLAQWAKAL
jgi:peptidoglycan hydrolase-like protein with peptidoglycan-binding domain